MQFSDADARSIDALAIASSALSRRVRRRGARRETRVVIVSMILAGKRSNAETKTPRASASERARRGTSVGDDDARGGERRHRARPRSRTKGRVVRDDNRRARVVRRGIGIERLVSNDARVNHGTMRDDDNFNNTVQYTHHSSRNKSTVALRDAASSSRLRVVSASLLESTPRVLLPSRRLHVIKKRIDRREHA